MAEKTLEERLKEITDSKQKEVEAIVADFATRLNELDNRPDYLTKKAPTFLDWAGAAYTLLPEGVKGFVTPIIDSAQAVVQALGSTFDATISAWQSALQGDFRDAAGDLAFGYTNLPITLVEAAANTVLQGVATGSSLAGLLPPEWGGDVFKSASSFFQQQQQGVATLADATRSGILRLDQRAFRSAFSDFVDPVEFLTNPQFSDFSPSGGVDFSRINERTLTDQEELYRMINTSVVNAQFNEVNYGRMFGGDFTFEDFSKGTVGIRNDIVNFTDNVIETVLMARGAYDRVESTTISDSKIYESMRGTATSIGNIFSMLAMAKVVKATNGQVSPQTVANTARTYYFAQMAGRSYAEAIENGADIQDAFTYALGVAASETAIENLGGIKFDKLFSNKLAIQNMLEEGLEEVVAEFSQPGLEMYRTGEQAPIDAGEVLTNSLLAFGSGAVASGFIGGSQAIMFNMTVNRNDQKMRDNWVKNVEKVGEEAALEMLEQEINATVDKLNRKVSLGQVVDKNGNVTIKNMSLEERTKFVQQGILQSLIKVDSEGKFSVDQEALNKFSEESFQNKDKDGNIVNDTEYAINTGVKGVDLSDGGKVDVVRRSELNDAEQSLVKFADNLTVPIAFYKSENQQAGVITNASYGDNGVVYLNIESLKTATPQEMANIVLKHEAIHELKMRDPQGFAELQRSLDNIFDVEFVENENGDLVPQIVFQNKEIEALIGKELEQDILASLIDYQQQGATPEQILQLLEEEKVAYFTERVITDAAYLELVDLRSPGLIKRIQQKLSFTRSSDINISVKSKGARNLLKQYAAAWRTGIQNVEANRNRLENYVGRIFGTDIVLSRAIKAEALKKYGIQKIKNGMETYNKNDNTIELDGERVKIEDIFKETWNEDVQPKRVQALTPEQMAQTFTFEESARKKYIRDLKRYSRNLDSAIADAESDQRIELRNKLNLIESLLDEFEDSNTFVPTDPEQINIIIESDIHGKRGREGVVSTTKTMQRTPEGKALFRTVTRAVRLLKSNSAFQDFRNGAFTTGAAYYTEQVASETQAQDNVKVLEILIQNLRTPKGKTLLKGDYEADYTFDPKTNTATFMIAPTEEYLQREITKEAEALIQEERQDDISSAETNEGMTDEQRKELQKYYTSTEMATNAFNNVVGKLEEINIDINEMTIIESSAGDGSFVDVFKTFNPDIEVEAYDIKPESPDVRKQDFLKLDKEFDLKNIVIGNPPYAGDMDARFIEKGLEMAPAVGFVLPATWYSSYSKQSQLDPKYKLILNERLGVETFSFGNQRVPVKTVLQLWVDPTSDPRFETTTDLRQREPNPRKSEFFYSTVLNGSTERYQKFKSEVEAGFEFDFAVHLRGNYKDYNKKITSLEDIAPKSEYLVVKANNQEALDALNSIDFEQLALFGSDHRKGFKLYDLIYEFNRKIAPKRVQRKAQAGENVPVDSAGFTLSEEQVEFFKESKIRDADNNLERLYHGSLNPNIVEFSPEFAGQATGVPERIMYFTNDFKTADEFSNERIPTQSMFFDQKSGRKGEVYQVYIDMKNPFDFRNLTQKEIDLLTDLVSQQFGIVDSAGRQWIESIKENHQIGKTVLDNEILEQNGYDGIIAEMYLGTGIFEYGVLSPEQIKSTDNLDPQPTANIYDSSISIKRVQQAKRIEAEEKAEIGRIFGDDILGEFFEVNKKGNYVPKKKYIIGAEKRRNKAKVRHINKDGIEAVREYSGSEYAVNVDIANDVTLDLSGVESKSGNDVWFEMVKLSDLTKGERAVFEVLKSLGIRFVGYTEAKYTSGAAGFSRSNQKTDTFYINLKYLTENPDMVFEVLIHEYTHELYKSDVNSLVDSARYLHEILFDSKNQVNQKLFDTLVDKGFIGYLRRNYKAFKNLDIKTPEDLGKLLQDGFNGKYDLTTQDDKPRALNELIAQLYGRIFSSKNFLAKTFKVDSVKSLQLHNLYDQLLKKANTPAAKQVFQQFGSSFYRSHEAHQKRMKQLYPAEKLKITSAEVDKFIKDFSSGTYNTRLDLVNEYLKEIKNGKRGEAYDTLKGVIYLASQFGQTVKTGYNSYKALQEEMEKTIRTLDSAILNPQDAAYLTKEGIVKDYKQLVEKISKPNTIFTELMLMGSSNTVNFFNTYAFVDMVRDMVTDFAERYDALDPNIVEALGLPNQTNVNALYSMVLNALDQQETNISLFNNKSISESDFNQDTLNFLSAPLENFFDEITSIEKLSKAKYSTLLGINTIQAEVLKRDSRIFLNQLKNKLKATKKYIGSKSLQANSPYNQELQEAFSILGDMIKSLEKTQLNTQTQQKEMLKFIKQLESIIIGEAQNSFTISERLEDAFAVFNPDGSVDLAATREALKQRFMYDIYGAYSALYDNNILEQEFPNMNEIKGRTLQELGFKKQYSQFSNALSNYLVNLQTEYTSVLSNDTMTHKDFAEALVDEVTTKIDDPDKVKHLRKSNFELDITTPQDFFAQYAETFKREGVDFFENFWEVYYNSVQRAEMILAEYDRASMDFLSENDKILEWEKEKVKVPSGLFINFSNAEYLGILGRVQKEYDETTQKIREKAEENKKLKLEYDGAKKKSNDIRDKMANLANKTTQKYKTLQAEYQKAREESKKRREAYLKGKQEYNSLKERPDYEFYLKEALLKASEKKTGSTEVELSKGEILSLYESVYREQEMHDMAENPHFYSGDINVKPTNHFGVGGGFNLFDSELAKKNYSTEKERAAGRIFTIMVGRKEILNKLGDIIRKDGNFIKMSAFGKSRFEYNYQKVNEVYKQIFQVDLPRQETYIPFRSVNSDWARDFELKLKNRINLGAPDAMTLETTLGASTPLAIQNYSSVITGSTKAASNYSHERIIHDFQNLMVTRVNGTLTFSDVMASSIDGGTFVKQFQRLFTNILGYGEQDYSRLERLANEVITNNVVAIMASNVSATFKQFISLYTIAVRNDLDITSLLKNLGKQGIPGVMTEYRRWLMDNNPNFYNRTKVNGVLALAEMTQSSSSLGQLRTGWGKAKNWLSKPAGWTDSAVLVSAFATIVEQVQKENAALSKQEVFNQANEIFNRTVLLYGVANTNAGFRSTYSTDKNILKRTVTRFQSENILQVSYLVRQVRMRLAGFKDTDVLGASATLLGSGLMSAMISTLFNRFRGLYEDDEEMLNDFLFNQFLLQNIIGSIPYVNAVSSLFQFTLDDKRLEQAFDETLPGISEIAKTLGLVLEITYDITDGKSPWRNVVRLGETLGQITGMPVRNIVRITELVTKFSDFGVEFEEFYYSRTNAQQLARAVSSGNSGRIEYYVQQTLTNTAVKNSVIKTLTKAKDAELNLRQYENFRAKNPLTGDMVEYDIPARTQEKYNLLAQRALQFLIRNPYYIRMSEEEKVDAMQRVFNYYYDKMKDEILVKEYGSLSGREKLEIGYADMRRKTVLPFEDVVQNAIRG